MMWYIGTNILNIMQLLISNQAENLEALCQNIYLEYTSRNAFLDFEILVLDQFFWGRKH